MIVTQPKPMEEVLEAVEWARTVFLVGCQGCPVGADTGGPDKLDALAGTLKEKGKTVSGQVMIDFLCNKALVGIRLGRHAEAIAPADAILVSACGIGVQAVGQMTDKPPIPVLNTLSVEGIQGLWPSSERCGQCGDCVLHLTGGICPIVACSKSLVNGACGGYQDGKCEISSERPCGWIQIYERLESLGQLENLKRPIAPRDHSKYYVPDDWRRSTRWALEIEEPVASETEGNTDE